MKVLRWRNERRINLVRESWLKGLRHMQPLKLASFLPLRLVGKLCQLLSALSSAGKSCRNPFIATLVCETHIDGTRIAYNYS